MFVWIINRITIRDYDMITIYHASFLNKGRVLICRGMFANSVYVYLGVFFFYLHRKRILIINDTGRKIYKLIN